MQIAYIIGIIVVVVVLIKLLSPKKPQEFHTKEKITDEKIKKAVKEGNMIEAIKMYKELYKVDLKEAKSAVEKIAKES